MALPLQTTVLLKTARQLVQELDADAVLFLTEKDLDWDAVKEMLGGCRLLVAAEDNALSDRLKANPNLTVLDIDMGGPVTTSERLSQSLLEAVATEKLRS